MFMADHTYEVKMHMESNDKDWKSPKITKHFFEKFKNFCAI